MRRTPTVEEVDQVVEVLDFYGWRASRGWARDLLVHEASGNLDNLVWAVRDLGGERDFFMRCALDGKPASYVLAALRRAIAEQEEMARFRAGYDTRPPLEESAEDARAVAN